MDSPDAPQYGSSHPLDVERAKATVGDDNRFTRLRDNMHKQLEDRSKRIEQVPLQALDIVVDFLFYQQHMLSEIMTSAIEPGDAVKHILWQGRIEQTRILAQEIATVAAIKRAKLKEGPNSGPEGEE